ncbi:hypothetical protein TD95_000533 [Thielaviopsis punctulata]|uniref:C-CAP/cofactor C-like domain-containing protein n=1 Tax=Thielaviopsis punctulata TaxID=72032 RepID=A0A0F4Z934_9PEZI|nr:hypothetical protein TD95_000533 [Thielaviopsis punctulata]
MEMTNEQFYKHFQDTIASLEESISQLSPEQTAEERNALVDSVRAGISTLTKELADASANLPSYDQRNFNESLKSTTANLNISASRAAPKPRFKFRPGAGRPSHVIDSRKLTSTQDSASSQRAQSSCTSDGTSTATAVSGKDYNEEVRTQISLVRQPSFSTAKDVVLSNHTDVRIALPESAKAATASGRLTDIERCVVDMAGATRSGTPFAGFAIKNVKQSVVITGTVAGPVHITSITDSVLVVVARQVRIHECRNVDIYLYCGSRPIIEDCEGLRFTEAPEYYSPGDLLGENQWDQVDDFKWLKADKSPNWDILEADKRVGDDVWKSLDADNELASTAVLERVGSWC